MSIISTFHTSADRLSGRLVRLREVSEQDAPRMIELRSAPELTRFLPPLNTDIERQKEWIKSLHSRTDDFMFASETLAKRNIEGYLGVYGINNGDAEWGRWIMREASPVGLESVLLLHRFVFEELGLSRVFCRTVTENTKVVAFHDKYGARRNGILSSAIKVGPHVYDMVEHEITAEIWPNIWRKFSRLLFRQ